MIETKDSINASGYEHLTYEDPNRNEANLNFLRIEGGFIKDIFDILESNKYKGFIKICGYIFGQELIDAYLDDIAGKMLNSKEIKAKGLKSYIELRLKTEKSIQNPGKFLDNLIRQYFTIKTFDLIFSKKLNLNIFGKDKFIQTDKYLAQIIELLCDYKITDLSEYKEYSIDILNGDIMFFGKSNGKITLIGQINEYKIKKIEKELYDIIFDSTLDLNKSIEI